MIGQLELNALIGFRKLAGDMGRRAVKAIGVAAVAEFVFASRWIHDRAG